MMTNFNNYPRYEKMQNMARELLLELPVQIPIKTSTLLKYVAARENLEIYTFQDYADIQNFELTASNIEKYFQSKDANITYCSKEDIFLLLYNEDMPSVRRKWTFGHELGHYFAGHHFLFSDEEKKSKKVSTIMEQEANCFAREYLAPSGLILYIVDHYNSRDAVALYTVLHAFFKLSKAASFYIAKDLSKVHDDYIRSKIYRIYIDIINKYDKVIENKIFSNLPTLDDFYAWTRRYQEEYSIEAYYYHNKPLLVSDSLTGYLLKNLIQSINNKFKYSIFL